MKKMTILAAIASMANANTQCVDAYTQVAATEKVKAESRLAVAKNLKKTAEGLLDTAKKALPAAKKAVTDFEGNIQTAEFKAAQEEYNLAYEASLGPAAEFRALKQVRDAKLDAMRAAFNDYEALQQLQDAYKDSWEKARKLASDLEFAESKDSTPQGAKDLLVYQGRAAEAKKKYDDITGDTQKAKEIYEAAGEDYLKADQERQAAQEVSVAA